MLLCKAARRSRASRIWLRETSQSCIRAWGHQPPYLLPVFRSHGRPYPAGADGVLAGELDQLDAIAGQLLRHTLVVAGGDGAKGLRAHEPAGDGQGGGDLLGEQGNVQIRLGVLGPGPVLDKVGGEGGCGYQIASAILPQDIRDIRRPSLGHFPAQGRGKGAVVLADDEYMEGIHLAGSGLQ